MAMGDVSFRWLDDNFKDLASLSDRIWSYAELALREHKSARDQIEYLKNQGFRIREGVAGMPMAFIATWGDGRPYIGFLGEFDALPGCNNAPVPFRKETIPGGNGHACGHNLLGVGALAAAVALKEELVNSAAKATIRYYGCPAEENYGGKAFMAREGGILDDLDACLTWHPGSTNAVSNGSSLAVIGVKFHFHGITAHAAGSPEHGRSALDALEIMNVGANYLREHVTDHVRIHYVTVNGGGQPNVVPAEATVWYYIRAPKQQEVEEVFERIKKCAEGASIMTETTYDVELVNALADVVNNKTLESVLALAMDKVGAPKYTEKDFEFAREITKTLDANQHNQAISKAGLSVYKDDVLHTSIKERTEAPSRSGGSTDVGDVSQVVPTAQFRTACQVLGTPGHSWQVTSQSGMGIGHAGMIAAAKVMAYSGLYLLENPDLLRQAKEDFLEQMAGRTYKSFMPMELKPPVFSPE